MGYIIRDVTKALFDRITARNPMVVQDGKNVRVRVLVGTPDEAIAKKRYPSINISPGFYINSKKDWQSSSSEVEIDGTSAKTTVTRNIDIFYTYKINMFALFNEHISYLEDLFFRIFSQDFCLNVIAESDGLSYPTQAGWDGFLVNVDDEKKSVTNPAIAENLIEGDQKVLRRDGLVTVHITMEDSGIETDLRPFSGVDITVETTLNS